MVKLGIDRHFEDETEPRAADGLGSAPPELPGIPDDASRLPADSDRSGDQSPAERLAEYKAKVEAEYRQEAVDRGCDRVSEIERMVVTPAMLRIEAEDPDRRLVGFENRLKGRERLAEKAQAAMAEKNRTPDEAFATVKDAIRYTFQYTEEKYTAGVYADCTRLEASGFKPYDRVNSWQHDQYKGINSRWREPNSGFLFEVQFHTRASFEAKELTHAAYEKLRGTPAPPKDEQARLAEFQSQVTARVPIPSRSIEVPGYSYK